MTYTQLCMLSALMEEMLNTYNKYSANTQKGKMKYLQGMIHGVYTSIEMCGGSVKIMHKNTDKDGNPTQFVEYMIDYKCHRFHAFMKTYYNVYKKRR